MYGLVFKTMHIFFINVYTLNLTLIINVVHIIYIKDS